MARNLSGTLVANTVKTESIDAYCAQITVINRSQTGEIWATFDGTTPVVEGVGSFPVLGAQAMQAPSFSQITTVKLLSTGALKYSLIGES